MKQLFFILTLCTSISHCFSQADNGALTIINEENKTLVLSMKEVAAMPHISVDVKAHDGNMHSYSGILLMTLLKQAGVRLGDSAKKNVAGSYVVITASDKYKAVYALSEIDTLQSNKTIVLADKTDGKALPQNALPYQIIATGEKIHARMIRQVTSIEVKRAM